MYLQMKSLSNGENCYTCEHTQLFLLKIIKKTLSAAAYKLIRGKILVCVFTV